MLDPRAPGRIAHRLPRHLARPARPLWLRAGAGADAIDLSGAAALAVILCHRDTGSPMSRLSKGEKEFVSGFAAREASGSSVEAGGAVLEIDARGISSPLHVLRAHRA